MQNEPKQRTRKNAKFGGQPREKFAHVSLTIEQHARFVALAGLLGVSREELVRQLIQKKLEEVSGILPQMASMPVKETATLTSDSQVSGGIDE